MTKAEIDALAELVEKDEKHECQWECVFCANALEALMTAAPALIAAARREAVYREALEEITQRDGYVAMIAHQALKRAGGGDD